MKLRKIAFSLLIFVMLGVFVEVGVRGYYRVQTGSWEIPAKYFPAETLRYKQDAHLGMRLRPSSEYRINEKHVSVNSLGFRGPEIAMPKPEGQVRVACIGGSTTFDTRVTSDELSWPEQLERELRARRPGVDYEVVNCGVPGYTTAESLVHLALWVVDIDPDLVIVYHTWNDLKPAQEPGFLPDYSHWRVPQAPYEPSLVQRALMNSFAYLKARRTLVRASQRRAQRTVEAAAPGTAVLPDEARRTFERNLRSMIGLGRTHGFDVALSTFATRASQHDEGAAGFDVSYAPNFSPAELQRSFRVYADTIRALVTEEDAFLIDAESRLRGEELFGDYVHFSDEGARVMAEVAFEDLDAQGVWERLEARPDAR